MLQTRMRKAQRQERMLGMCAHWNPLRLAFIGSATSSHEDATGGDAVVCATYCGRRFPGDWELWRSGMTEGGEPEEHAHVAAVAHTMMRRIKQDEPVNYPEGVLHSC